ncbi:DUF4242 domain-containing protein [Aegicerativicinus sediminis]|uniref:DUF4242 domain-containing protein n=1 Tax=Aegicerativicinus sediminis TaxID=2893202 RepID=UPI001E3FA8A7|nr:DUF4242 domain-containing protein [Aegicerativicinus sediminis]
MKILTPLLLLTIFNFSCKEVKETEGIVIEEPDTVLEVAQKPIERNMYIDVHHLGEGNVSAEAVADAHTKDLATQDKYGVKFIEYWVDEKNGNVYCVSQSPSPDAITETHKHAHGLEPNDVVLVTDGMKAGLTGKTKLFLDIHELGAGNVTADAVAEAHQKDLEFQEENNVNFINYWVDEKNGMVYCLSESPNSESVIKTHTEAHGLVPKEVIEIVRGE